MTNAGFFNDLQMIIMTGLEAAVLLLKAHVCGMQYAKSDLPLKNSVLKVSSSKWWIWRAVVT